MKSIGKRNCHLWAEQYCGAFPQLPAGARIYHGDVRTEWRLWRSDECICVGGPHAGIIDVRHGNRFLPLCQ